MVHGRDQQDMIADMRCGLLTNGFNHFGLSPTLCSLGSLARSRDIDDARGDFRVVRQPLAVVGEPAAGQVGEWWKEVPSNETVHPLSGILKLENKPIKI